MTITLLGWIFDYTELLVIDIQVTDLQVRYVVELWHYEQFHGGRLLSIGTLRLLWRAKTLLAEVALHGQTRWPLHNVLFFSLGKHLAVKDLDILRVLLQLL